jgi:hypothetical protein
MTHSEPLNVTYKQQISHLYFLLYYSVQQFCLVTTTTTTTILNKNKTNHNGNISMEPAASSSPNTRPKNGLCPKCPHRLSDLSSHQFAKSKTEPMTKSPRHLSTSEGNDTTSSEYQQTQNRPTLPPPTQKIPAPQSQSQIPHNSSPEGSFTITETRKFNNKLVATAVYGRR